MTVKELTEFLNKCNPESIVAGGYDSDNIFDTDGVSDIIEVTSHSGEPRTGVYITFG